jgi:hypothetical protein
LFPGEGVKKADAPRRGLGKVLQGYKLTYYTVGGDTVFGRDWEGSMLCILRPRLFHFVYMLVFGGKRVKAQSALRTT